MLTIRTGPALPHLSAENGQEWCLISEFKIITNNIKVHYSCQLNGYICTRIKYDVASGGKKVFLLIRKKMMKKILLSAFMMVSLAVMPSMAQSVKTQNSQKAKKVNSGTCAQAATCAGHNAQTATCHANAKACQASNTQTCCTQADQKTACTATPCTQSGKAATCTKTHCTATKGAQTHCTGNAKAKKAVKKGSAKKVKK